MERQSRRSCEKWGFLLKLCELELIDREKRSTERRLKAAQFPQHKTLDDFDFSAQPSLNRVLISELLRGEYIDRREVIILIGNPGTGNAQPSQYPSGHRGLQR
ncbi:ATP-binding protein [Thalassoroseus pseudoceratinae]|uniref:ATP-binding protein n=1 Tax=Thalassoroseus pseudoceratinae TaxID=2713176 RepID=UPI001F0E52C0|nr:ATP-binding protein [Thalassoroseus pseudoceratinae]